MPAFQAGDTGSNPVFRISQQGKVSRSESSNLLVEEGRAIPTLANSVKNDSARQGRLAPLEPR